MTKKTVSVTYNGKTGSYTVRVPKNAATGTFVSESKATGRIEVRASSKKTH